MPGSHIYGLHQRPLPEDTVPAEMEAGSALFWLGELAHSYDFATLVLKFDSSGSTYHGAGANTCTPGEENDV